MMSRTPVRGRTPVWGPGTKPANQEYLDSMELLIASLVSNRKTLGRFLLNVEDSCDHIASIIDMSARTIAAGVGRKFAANELRTIADLIDPPIAKEDAQLTKVVK